MKRSFLYKILQIPSLSETQAKEILQKEVYRSTEDWSRMIPLFSYALGIGFLIVGMIIGIVKVWDDLSKLAIFIISAAIPIVLSVLAYAFRKFSNLSLAMGIMAHLSICVPFITSDFLHIDGATQSILVLVWLILSIPWIIIRKHAVHLLIGISLLCSLWLALLSDFHIEKVNELSAFLITLSLICLYGYAQFSNQLKNWGWNTIVDKIVWSSIGFFSIMGIIININIVENNFYGAENFLFILIVILNIALLVHAYKLKNIFKIAITGFVLILIPNILLLNVFQSVEGLMLFGGLIVLCVSLMVYFLQQKKVDWYGK